MQVSKSIIKWLKDGTKGGRKVAERFLLDNGFTRIGYGSEKEVFHKIGHPFVVKVHPKGVRHKVPKGVPRSLRKFFAETHSISTVCHLQEIVKVGKGSSYGPLNKKMTSIFEGVEASSNHREDRDAHISSEFLEFNLGINSIGRPVVIDC